MKTVAVEDYLKAIYVIGQEQERVSTMALAVHLRVAPASVTGMMKKLSTMKLITHEPYRGVGLTLAGRKMALEVIRHHRLVELYLAEALGVPWDQVHEEAEKWEHILSEDLEERMDAALGYPKADPHGAPIPDREGVIEEAARTQLSLLQPGDHGVIAEVSDDDAALLRYVGGLGLYPGVHVHVIAVEPFNGPIRLRIKGKELSVGREVAQQIYITEVARAKGEAQRVR
ncbi:metal-dependent transcriptional regulator [Candidatus Acetothermia bacterium]|nr:metal-dependent transcriptional regulator [Candidatus Acetothermia bacterium]